MTDRELLQLAAKAAGYTLTDHYDVEGRYWPWCEEKCDYWNPMWCGDDTLRLATDLRINLEFNADQDGNMTVKATPPGGKHPSWFEPDIFNDIRAVGTAVTMCAAEIGRRMG